MMQIENNKSAQWPEIMGDIQKSWSKISHEDLEKTRGDMKAIGSLIDQRYANTKSENQVKLSEIFSRHDGNEPQNGISRSQVKGSNENRA